MSTVDIISSISDITVALSALGTFFVAIYGVKNWSRELKGKAEFESSKSLLKAVYKYRDAINSSRSIIILGSQEEIDTLNKNKARKLEVWTSLFNARWKPVSEATQELMSQSVETEVLLGKEVKELIDILGHITQDLRVSMSVFMNFDVDPKPEEIEFYEKHPEIWKEIEYKLVKDPSGKDTMSSEINETISQIENKLKFHLKRY